MFPLETIYVVRQSIDDSIELYCSKQEAEARIKSLLAPWNKGASIETCLLDPSFIIYKQMRDV